MTSRSPSPASGQMFTRYGKMCRNKKSSASSSESADKPAEKDTTEELGDEDKAMEKKAERRKSNILGSTNPHADNADDDDDNDEENEDAAYRKSSSHGKSDAAIDKVAGMHDEAENSEDTVESSDKKYVEGEDETEPADANNPIDDEENESYETSKGTPDSEDTPGNEGEIGSEARGEDDEETAENDQDRSEKTFDDEPFEDEQTFEDDETSVEETSDDGRKRKKVKPVLEYDIKDMYPEINILVQKKKREWDFQDPDIIRAIWLETKTQSLAEWKVRNAKIKIDKPSYEVRETHAFTLRQEHLKNKAELQQANKERDFEMTDASREPPHFDAIQLATNLTTDMRYKYNRNNPPVPSHYIEHFEKFKKPPFKNTSKWCIHP